jgi:hypothetical protein
MEQNIKGIWDSYKRCNGNIRMRRGRKEGRVLESIPLRISPNLYATPNYKLKKCREHQRG